MKTTTIPNLAKIQSIIWWILSAVLIAGIFLPFVVGADAEQWGFGIAFLCLIFGITAVVMAVIYTRRASLVSRMLKYEDLLAHWKYAPGEWRSYALKEHEVNKREKRNLFLLIMFITLLAGAILTISIPDGAPVIILTVIVLVLVDGNSCFFKLN